MLHISTVGMGFIPVLPTADKIQSKYPATARVGINPTPTLDVCCKCFINLVFTWLHEFLFICIFNPPNFAHIVRGTDDYTLLRLRLRGMFTRS